MQKLELFAEGNFDFRALQGAVVHWAEARQIIPNSTPAAQLRKAFEELDEALYAAKALEVSDAFLTEFKDGIGDTMVCLINACALADVDPLECLALAYNEIKDRKGHLGTDGIFYKDVK